VRAGALSVAITGDRPKGWRKHMKVVVDLLDLNSGGWGRIRVHKDELLVDDVREGAEDDLRQLLEGAVLQANSDVDAGAGAEEEGEPDDAGELADRRMSDTFRAFAERRSPIPSVASAHAAENRS
jgi:hypothetical protein